MKKKTERELVESLTHIGTALVSVAVKGLVSMVRRDTKKGKKKKKVK